MNNVLDYRGVSLLPSLMMRMSKALSFCELRPCRHYHHLCGPCTAGEGFVLTVAVPHSYFRRQGGHSAPSSKCFGRACYFCPPLISFVEGEEATPAPHEEDGSDARDDPEHHRLPTVSHWSRAKHLGCCLSSGRRVAT